MKKTELTLFTIKAEQLFDTMLNKALNEGKQLGVYSIKDFDTDTSLQKIEILNKLMKWPRITFLRDTLSVSHVVKDLPIHQAQSLFPNSFSYSVGSSTVSVLTVIYQINYEGDLKALELSVNYNQRTIPAEMNGQGILVLFFYSQKTVEEVKDQIKQERDNLLSLLEQNQKSVDEFFKSKREVLLNAINSGYDSGKEAALRHQQDNNSLL